MRGLSGPTPNLFDSIHRVKRVIEHGQTLPQVYDRRHLDVCKMMYNEDLARILSSLTLGLEGGVFFSDKP